MHFLTGLMDAHLNEPGLTEWWGICHRHPSCGCRSRDHRDRYAAAIAPISFICFATAACYDSSSAEIEYASADRSHTIVSTFG